MSVQEQRHARKVQSAAVTCSILMELVDLKFKREKTTQFIYCYSRMQSGSNNSNSLKI